MSKRHYRISVDIAEVTETEEEVDRYNKHIIKKAERNVIGIQRFSIKGDVLNALVDKAIAHLELSKEEGN